MLFLNYSFDYLIFFDYLITFDYYFFPALSFKASVKCRWRGSQKMLHWKHAKTTNGPREDDSPFIGWLTGLLDPSLLLRDTGELHWRHALTPSSVNDNQPHSDRRLLENSTITVVRIRASIQRRIVIRVTIRKNWRGRSKMGSNW